MATITINVEAQENLLLAVDDIYETIKNGAPQNILVLANDYLGTEPTIIDSIDTTGFTYGTIIIDPSKEYLVFTFNGSVVSGSQNITYTIKDSTEATSTATVTINVSA